MAIATMKIVKKYSAHAACSMHLLKY